MRYVRLQTTVTKVVDEVVDDALTIKSILENLKSQELTCSLTLSDSPKMTNVRINKVGDDSFSFKVINKQSTVSNSSSFSNVSYLEVNTNAETLCRNKPNVGRFSLLDTSSED